MSTPSRVFVGRLTSLSVFDPLGDQVGRVRDVVVTFGASRRRPRVIGLVVEIPGRRRVFVPMTRVTSVDGGQVITTGLVNMRRFEQRGNEVLVMAEILERPVTVHDAEGDSRPPSRTSPSSAAQRRLGMSKVFVRRHRPQRARPVRRRRGATVLVPVEDVTGITSPRPAQSAPMLLATYDDLKPADLADVLHDLSPKRRVEVAEALDDDRLADVLEEMPEDDQVEILEPCPTSRAADVLEAMEPDDAADLLPTSPREAGGAARAHGAREAEDVRRLLTYDQDTAGGLMTTEPVILGRRRRSPRPWPWSAATSSRPPSPRRSSSAAAVRDAHRPVPRHRALPADAALAAARRLGGILDKDIEPLPREPRWAR